MTLKRTSSHRLPHCILLLFCTIVTMTPLHAAPSVALATATDQSTITAVITGAELPAITAMSITCSYDPTKINLPDAIIFSPLSSTIIGALLRTSPDTSLLITVTATTSLTLSDDTPLVTLEIPAFSEPPSATGIHISKAEFTDTNGETHSAEITPTPVYHFPGYRINNTHTQHHRTGQSSYYLLNGRQIRHTGKNDLTTGTLILQRVTNQRRPVRIMSIR